ncbi:hypothetical protein FLL67_05060 [Vibrio cholerae]|nr:hypothetical protein [Vibrio cholerae]EGQ9646165.1 hypothetical protein [Vibrio cholerae]TQQ32211.1 hypothetical protein FLL67_05060 [Vibrio cholerae]TQQ68123.1 hypothetical protein FLL60_17780 [Vibrio cholerae]TXZ57564.1 hypothetical protein FXE24_05360 [Vibrio cholerae]
MNANIPFLLDVAAVLAAQIGSRHICHLFCRLPAPPSCLGIVIAGIVRANTLNTRINGCCFMLAALLG